MTDPKRRPIPRAWVALALQPKTGEAATIRYANTMRLGVLGGSLLSGLFGAAVLARALPRRPEGG